MKFYLLKITRKTRETNLLKTWDSLDLAMPFLKWSDKKLTKATNVFHNIIASTYCKTEQDYNDCGAKGLSWFDKAGFEYAIVRQDSPLLKK
jgi:hypothetical protein